jgi:hypothetical protein
MGSEAAMETMTRRARMMVVNPGTQAMSETSPKLAKAGIAQFVEDLHPAKIKIKVKRDKKSDNDGWYGFTLKSKHAKISVLMPGLPLEYMRGTKKDTTASWAFQRLYVEGNSWYWNFALEIAQERLLEKS